MTRLATMSGKLGVAPRIQEDNMSNRTDSLAKKDIAYNLHPYTNLAAHEDRGPLVITRGEGSNSVRTFAKN